MPETSSSSSRRCPSGSARTRAKKEGRKVKLKSDTLLQLEEAQKQLAEKHAQLQSLQEELEIQRVGRARAEHSIRSMVARLSCISQQQLSRNEQRRVQPLLTRVRCEESETGYKPRTEDLLELLQAVVGDKRQQENSAPVRCEQLERRVTQLSQELAALVQLTVLCEEGLEQFQHMYDVSTMHQHARALKYSRLRIVGELSAFQPKIKKEEPVTTLVDLRSSDVCDQWVDTSHGLDLTPPAPDEKLCGSTPVRFLKADLREFIIREMSFEKTAGNDWRQFAERVGLKPDEVRLSALGAKSRPMAHALTLWEQEEEATVRLLHRHLKSPQIRCHLLAKRLSSFYDVE